MLTARHRHALQLAGRFIAPYRWRVAGALAALLFTAVITLSMGQGIRLLVDGIPATTPDGQAQGSSIALPSIERIEVGDHCLQLVIALPSMG